MNSIEDTKLCLDKAFEVGDKVVIGLSSDEFVSKMGKPHDNRIIQ